MQFLDTLKEWTMDGRLAIAGAITLAVTFATCFCCKTAWGQWYNRKKQDEIYGEPGANMDEQKHPTHQER